MQVRRIFVEKRHEHAAEARFFLSDLQESLHLNGLHTVRVHLHPEVDAEVTVNVARSPEEAEMQASGVDVMASMFERDEAGFTEDYDPNAEPGENATEAPAAEDAQG